jgi:LPS-assembly lipoprotein
MARHLCPPVVDTASGRALSATLTGNLTYTLRQGSTIVTTGVATSLTTYDRFEQRFATVRAARDAEIRLARELAGQVRTRLQAELSRR